MMQRFIAIIIVLFQISFAIAQDGVAPVVDVGFAESTVRLDGVLDDDAWRLLRRRWAEIEEAGRAETIGVIVGLKPGQRRLAEALKVRDELTRMGKSAHILAMREITPESLENFSCFGAFVNTACPRVSLDADSAFQRPVLTLKEAYVMLGKLSWEDLLRNGII